MISAWQYSLSPYLTSPLVYTPYRFLRVRTNDRRSSVPLDNTAQGGSLCARICRLLCKNYESLIMNCLDGIVERDARPPILFTLLLFTLYFFTLKKQGFLAKQTRLLLIANKACLQSKEALFLKTCTFFDKGGVSKRELAEVIGS